MRREKMVKKQKRETNVSEEDECKLAYLEEREKQLKKKLHPANQKNKDKKKVNPRNLDELDYLPISLPKETFKKMAENDQEQDNGKEQKFWKDEGLP